MFFFSKAVQFSCILTYLLFSSIAVSSVNGNPVNIFNGTLRKGTINSESGTLIVGGQEAIPGQYPFMVSLQVFTFQETWRHNCGGVIYDERHILTAAHCVQGYHPNNLRIVAGDHNIDSFEGTEQIRYVSSFVFHPDFDSFDLLNDIAIITLDQENPLVFNSRVQKVNLPSSYIEANGVAENVGWGNIRSDGQIELPAKLQFVNLDIVDREQCRQLYSGIADITNGMVCANGRNGATQGACNGDSGGPLICTSSNGQRYLCGLVSWGMVPCANSRFPSVFTNVAGYLDWLNGLLPPV